MVKWKEIEMVGEGRDECRDDGDDASMKLEHGV